MGVALTELLIKKEITVDSLQGKTIVVDAPMWLYQFLSSIRQRDGSLLTDSNGNPTSHLVGLFARMLNMHQQNIKLAFVFDGEPPSLKKKVLQQRKVIKQEAEKKYKEAVKVEDKELMKRYASMTSRLTKDMVQEAKDLVRACGLPVIEAPSEAEAQAALIVREEKAFAISTNDADALLFGAPRIVRNLNMAGRRKRTNKLAYETITPDMISLADNLNNLSIDQDQLIALSMLVGTDYNPKGIKGIGPKNALKLVKEFKKDLSGLFSHVKWSDHFTYSWDEVFDLIKNTKTTENYSLKWESVNKEAVCKLLVDKHDFSPERINLQLKPLEEEHKRKNQKGLSDFF